MTDVHHPDWDEEELVPLGELRPSRQYFGPLNSGNKDSKQQKGKNLQPPKNQVRQNQPQPTRRQQPARPRPDQARNNDQPSRRQHSGSREQEIDLRDSRPRPTRRPAPVGAREGEASRSRGSQSPQVQRPPSMRERRPEQTVVRRPGPRRPEPPIDNKSNGLRSALGRIGGEKSNSQEMREILHAPVTDGTLAVFSRKGGVGKTTISAYLGLTLAAERGGRILAIDGDAEAGSLGWMMAPKAPATLAALSSAEPVPSSFQELRQYVAPTAGGLDIVVGDTDGREVVDQRGLESALVQVAQNYDISIFDTGGGVSVSASRVLVKHAKVMLLIMSPSVDSIRAAERTLAWVNERPGEAADPNVKIIAVINGIPDTVKESHVARIEQHFAARCTAVVRIPWDQHLAEGSTEVSLGALNKNTRRAFVQLAATTVKVMAKRGARRPEQGSRRAS